jgi:dCMP deaminase
MSIKDPIKRKKYHRNYYRLYMKTVGLKYRKKSEQKQLTKIKNWKTEGALEYKLKRIQKMYGKVGVDVFIRDNCSCVLCHETDFRVLIIHHIIPENQCGDESLENLITLCANCHSLQHIEGNKFTTKIKISCEEWDIHWLKYAKTISRFSNCLSRKIGSVLVKNNKLLTIGWNSPPQGVKHCNERPASHYCWLEDKDSCLGHLWDYQICPRRNFGYTSGKGIHLCQASHSERNAILQAAKDGISTNNTILYAYCALPCKDCCIELINAGIKEIVCLKGDLYDKYSKVILMEANIKIREIDRSLVDA